MAPKTLLILWAILFISSCLSADMYRNAPLIADVNISAPDPSLPDLVKSLSGQWTGTWDSQHPWDCNIYIEKIGENSAQLIHSWGEVNHGNNSCHCSRDWARIKNVKLSYSEEEATLKFRYNYRYHNIPGKAWNPGPSVLFRIRKSNPNVIEGEMITGHRHSIAIKMKKVQ